MALVISLLLTASPAWADSGGSTTAKVSLDTLLRRIRTDNPVVDIARAKLAHYRAEFTRAYYAWTPSLKVDALLAPLPERRLLQECVIDTWAVAGGADLPRIGPCPGQNIEDDQRITADTEIGIMVRTTAKVTLPIYTFGKVDAAQQAARAGLDVGRSGVEVAQAELEMMVKKAFYGAQLTADMLLVLNDGLKRMNQARASIQKELDKESGRFTSNDLRKLVVKQVELEVGILETNAMAAIAWEGLRLAGGYAVGQAFELSEPSLQQARVQPRDVEGYAELAAVSRADLRLAEAGLRARASLVDLEEANFYPDIALVGQFGYSKGTTADDNPDPFANDPYNALSWGVVLGASWRVDVNRVAKLRKARANLSKVRGQRAALLAQISLDLTQRVGAVDRYRQEVGVRRGAVKASKAWLVSETLNFGLGLATTDALITSLTAYSKARLAFLRAIYEYNLAVAQLSRSVGAELVVGSAAP